VTIDDIDDDKMIYWSEAHTKTDGTVPSDADTTTHRNARLSGLKDRVSRALKQLEKANPD
jgi:hypothetical protein